MWELQIPVVLAYLGIPDPSHACCAARPNSSAPLAALVKAWLRLRQASSSTLWECDAMCISLWKLWDLTKQTAPANVSTTMGARMPTVPGQFLEFIIEEKHINLHHPATETCYHSTRGWNTSPTHPYRFQFSMTRAWKQQKKALHGASSCLFKLELCRSATWSNDVATLPSGWLWTFLSFGASFSCRPCCKPQKERWLCSSVLSIPYSMVRVKHYNAFSFFWYSQSCDTISNHWGPRAADSLLPCWPCLSHCVFFYRQA